MYVEFKDGQKHAAKNADVSDDHTYFKDAGWVLNEDDLVIDIDCLERNVIEKMLVYFDIKTQYVWTDRGIHLYYKKPVGFRGTKRVCILGFEVEYKHIKNTKAVTIKRNGTHREVFNEGVREELPNVFVIGKKYSNLLGLTEGEGRNNSLFEHRMKINGVNNLSKVMIFINNNILSEPLAENELNVILRDRDIQGVKDGEYGITTQLIDEMSIHVYKGDIFYYNGMYFESDELKLKHQLYKVIGDQKTRYIDEISKQMLYRGKLIDEDKIFVIKLKNGVLKDGEFIDIDYKDFTPYYLDVEYVENATPVKEVDDYLDQLTNNNDEYKQLLLEVLAHTLITDPEIKRLLAKFFIFVGDGGNGKGTLLNIIRKILGVKNCTGLSIKEMSDERYVCNLELKLANLGDDIQDQPINDKDMKVLKNISTCDFIELRRLFKNSVSTTMTTSLIFTSNHILKSWEKGEAYKRRVMWLPMYTKPTKKDSRFITKLTTQDALEYWLYLIVQKYMSLYEDFKFTDCSIVEEFNNQYHEDNNGAIVFVKDLTPEEIEGKTGPDIYDEFVVWCEDNEYNPSKKMLNNAILEVHGMKIKPCKINRKTTRIYKKMED